MNREQLIEGLKQYALEKLAILEGYSAAQREYKAAASAYERMAGVALAERDGGDGLRVDGMRRGFKGSKMIVVLKGALNHPGLRRMEVGRIVNPGHPRAGAQGLIVCMKHNLIERKNGLHYITAAGRRWLEENSGAVESPELANGAAHSTSKETSNGSTNGASNGRSSNRFSNGASNSAGKRSTGVGWALILQELVKGPGRGSEISDRLGFTDQRRRSAVSVALSMVRDQGLVKAKKLGKGKTLYTITSAGQDKLAASLS